VIAAILDGIIVGIPSAIIMGILSVGAFTATTTKIEFDETTGELTNLEADGSFIGAFLVSWLILLVLGIAYYVYFHGSERGQTPGKMIMKIAVRDETTGGSIGYGRAAVRWLVAGVLWMLCYIPGIIDVLFPLWDDKRQTLHDKTVRSVVVEVQ